MPPPSESVNPYDENPFPRQSLAASDPSRLAATAALFGMRPAPLDHCRVLELGCATGGNLTPLAARHPRGTFVGIDYSQGQIALARQDAASLGLTNVEFQAVDFRDLSRDGGDDLGTFDYIICHGVFSWVSPPLQETVLELCHAHLNPQGLVFLSYNIYPGWHLRNLVRELVCDCTPATDPPAHRVAAARKLLDFFCWAFHDDPTPYGQLLKGEVELVLAQPDGYLLHEQFEHDNNPLYFHELIARLERHGLQYVADSDLATMFVENMGAAVTAGLPRLAHDNVAVEQHLDVLRNRAFRQSILCRGDVPLSRALDGGTLAGLYLIGNMRPDPPSANITSSELVKFVTLRGIEMWSPSPPLKAAFEELGRQFPRGALLEDLFAAVASRLGHGGRPLPADVQATLGRDLVQCLKQGVLDLRGGPDSFVGTVSDRPVTTPMARWQARQGWQVTSGRHESLTFDQPARDILQHLDGRHDRAALLKVFVDAVDRGSMTILVDGVPATRGNDVLGVLEQRLDKCLASLAINALLIG